jgi:adenosylhomocysteine nucleosidase
MASQQGGGQGGVVTAGRVRRLLVLTAVDVEARALARHLGLAPVCGSTSRFGGGSVEIAVVGLAAAHLDARLTSGPSPGTLVISAGACGALAPELAVGALVVPESVLTRDGRRLSTASVPGLARQGTLAGVDRVLEDAAAKSRLWLETGALAVDMESAAILDWAAARDLPAAVVRAVSDPAGRGVPADLARVVQDDGRVRPLRAVSAVLARPRALADAMALRAGAAAALKTVAAALGRLQRTA